MLICDASTAMAEATVTGFISGLAAQAAEPCHAPEPDDLLRCKLRRDLLQALASDNVIESAAHKSRRSGVVLAAAIP
jgi:hypothetical protein